MEPKERSVGASERDEWLRAAWKTMVAGSIGADRFVFVDECGTNTSRYARCTLGRAGASGRLVRRRATEDRTSPCSLA
jgi:hypothetical protein